MLLEESERADFDLLARPGVPRRGRILESGMRRPARAAGAFRIEDLEDEGFVAPHQRKPIPLVLGIVFDRIGLADAVGIAALGNDEILEHHAARVAEREREGLDGVTDRPPALYDRETILEQ